MATKLKTHLYADLFPMMTQAELDALTEDIAANGLRQDIVRYQGAILDGRNRLLACEKTGVEPRFTDYDGDDAGALALVISLNVQRRDLTAAQRAIVAARAMEQMPERRGRPAAGKNMDGPSIISREAVARSFKVGEKAVQQAKALLADAPDLASQVEVCAVSIAAAYEQLQERRKQTTQRAKDAERIAEYTDAISNGELTMEQAMQKLLEQQREERERLASEADARQHWLKEFVGVVEWVERFVATLTDDYLTWNTQPDTPGWFDHGITADRLTSAVDQLNRILPNLEGVRHGKQRSSKDRTRTA